MTLHCASERNTLSSYEWNLGDYLPDQLAWEYGHPGHLSMVKIYMRKVSIGECTI